MAAYEWLFLEVFDIMFSLTAETLVTKPVLVLGILLIVLAVALVILVLMQSGKDKGLSGTIAGGAETFFGKSKGSSMEKILSRITIAVSIVLVALVLVMLILLTKNT